MKIELAHCLTLTASCVALLSVVATYIISKKQIASTNALAIKQIKATSKETRQKLRTETIVEDRRKWIQEFQKTINDILYYGYPDMDSNTKLTLVKRQCNITKSALKIDLMMPVGKEHPELCESIASYAQLLIHENLKDSLSDRMNAASNITNIARRIVKTQQSLIENEYSTDE